MPPARSSAMAPILTTTGTEMASVDALTGTEIDELADIRQSVETILTTPVGSRVMRRKFGSELFDLVDSPGNESGALRLIAAAAAALYIWEDRVDVVRGTLSVGIGGQGRLQLVLRVISDNLTITADVPVNVR